VSSVFCCDANPAEEDEMAFFISCKAEGNNEPQKHASVEYIVSA